MAALGWEVTGLEVDEVSADNCRKIGFKVISGTLETCNLKDESFNAITLRSVIEHLHDPILAIRECYRLLKRDGLLYIETPNGASVGHALLGRWWYPLQPPYHLVLLNPKSLISVAERTGFQTCRLVGVCSPGKSMHISKLMAYKTHKYFNFRRKLIYLCYSLLGIGAGLIHIRHPNLMETFGCSFKKP